MDESLQELKAHLQADKRFGSVTMSLDQGELHLAKADEMFARLVPPKGGGAWHLEAFRNVEKWNPSDFQGTLRECIDFLLEESHYEFWE